MLKLFAAASAAVVMSASAMAASPQPLFTYGGNDYQLSDMQPDLQQRFYENLREAHDKNVALIEQAVLDVYIEQQAASRNLSSDQVREELLQVAPVTDKDVREVYDQYQGQIGMPFDQAKEPMRQHMEAVRAHEQALAVIQQAKEKNGFELKLTEVNPPVFAMDLSPFPSKGAENAEVTIVEIADYRCPFCKNGKEAVDELIKTYDGKVKAVYVDLPVVRSETGISQEVMAGAYCARQQGKYWEYNDAAFGMQRELSMESPGILTDRLGLDKKTFEVCMSSEEPGAYVVHSEEFARRYGVTGTPTFFVNGQRVYTSSPYVELKERVAEILSK